MQVRFVRALNVGLVSIDQEIINAKSAIMFKENINERYKNRKL